jgi:hypothetical protein
MGESPRCFQNPFTHPFTRPNNLARSHAYTGSAHRFRQLILSVLRGEKSQIKVGIIGGSVTLGHGVNDEDNWSVLYGGWLEGELREIAGRNDIHVQVQNGAVPAVESNYFTACWKEHLDEDLDMVIIEMSINDGRYVMPHASCWICLWLRCLRSEALAHSYEYLLRGLLELPTKPAVLNLHVRSPPYRFRQQHSHLHVDNGPSLQSYHDRRRSSHCSSNILRHANHFPTQLAPSALPRSTLSRPDSTRPQSTRQIPRTLLFAEEPG